MADIMQALLALYEAGLAVWDLSPKTLLLNIGREVNHLGQLAGDDGSGCFAEVDSLRRNQFNVKLKSLAIEKRLKCKQNLVCVPDAIVNRGCNADVYALGMLIL